MRRVLGSPQVSRLVLVCRLSAVGGMNHSRGGLSGVGILHFTDDIGAALPHEKADLTPR